MNERVAAERRQALMMDGNEAAARVAYRASEVIAIYPITPSSPMGELADEWASHGRPNLWGTVPLVQEMQAEGGAAGAVHGALQSGALTTTFTASQGLLLMIPNMYKIAGELTPAVFHVAARSIAAQALSIFGDHSDVMAARATGWAMLFAGSVQEVHDMALVAHAATLEARLPFLHVFDGFRTSHELARVVPLDDEAVRAMIDDDLVHAHRRRALSPDRPVVRGTAQNPDVFFQARETVNPYYDATPAIVQRAMDRLAGLTGRRYHLFDYDGDPEATRVIVLMGSGAESARETARLLAARGERVGVVQVRLYRPFDGAALVAALPPTTEVVAVLDRTKEPGSAGEPLYQDVLTAISEASAAGSTRFARPPRVVGGRYGLSSKEFTPGMVAGIFEEMARPDPRNHFTIGINDDVSHTSLRYDPDLSIEDDAGVRAIFWGLGSDGTVGANKNSIKIIGEEAGLYAQGYFVYDSKKSGARTISHLRFGPNPIHRPYLIRRAGFIAVHAFDFLERYDVLDEAEPGATLLLNSPYSADSVWDALPAELQKQIIEKQLRLFVIDAERVAREAGLGGRINTVMQVAFFALSGVLPLDEAITRIKERIQKTYGRRGEVVVRRNFAAVDAALAHLEEVTLPDQITGAHRPPAVDAAAPAFVREVTAPMIAGRGDELPVSALPVDGTYPTGTTRWEKRNIAPQVPIWDPELCIQCGKCVMVCPHAVIRATMVEPTALHGAPEGFLDAPARWKGLDEMRYTLQVAVEDCTGCELCVEICPARDKRAVGRKALEMVPQRAERERGREHWAFFEGLDEPPRTDGLGYQNVKDVQLLTPLFEFSGACAGCGETPYLILLSRLFGDRAIIANATGCSSIYGGNLPTTPWSVNRDGRGPAWSNSLFEDNAEFGLGMRLTLDKQREYAAELVERLRPTLGDELADGLLEVGGRDERAIAAQRARVAALVARLEEDPRPIARDLLSLAETLVDRSVWIVGGDGWAYDIGYGGLDHVLASGRNVNVLVLDTEVYSNTGGQASKATPLGAVAKFAAGGKTSPKKDLGRMIMNYGNVYVAQIAMGADDRQTLRAFREAESYDGPSLIIAYSQCIAHGIDMTKGMTQQKLAVQSGYWPLYRFDPRREAGAENPFQLDSKAPSIPFERYAYNENRYRILRQSRPDVAEELMDEAQRAVHDRWADYERMAADAPTRA